MLQFTSLPLLLAAIVTASTDLPGLASSNPVNVTSVEYKGGVSTSNPPNIYRDLGYWGRIGNVGIQSYGDTFSCTGGANGKCIPFGANSGAVSTDSPNHVNNIANARIFCDYLPSEKASAPVSSYGMGITNVVQTGDNKGVIYFAKNWRPNGEANIQGSGVAIVDTSGDEPTCTRTAEYWWDAKSNPVWGDHGAVDGGDGYIYVFGSANTAGTMWNGAKAQSDVYLARVRKSDATNQQAYQYWNGQTFDNDPIHPSAFDRGARLFTGSTGSILYNPYYQKYTFITTGLMDPFLIEILTADNPQGPWSDRRTVYDASKNPANAGQLGAYAYAPNGQPQFDESGQSLVISYTYTPNQQQVIKLNFGKGEQVCSGDSCMPNVVQNVASS